MTAPKSGRAPVGRQLAQPGDLVTIPEADHCYGVGALRLRLTVVGDGKPVHEGAEWVQVEGVELTRDGAERGQRRVLVRASALATGRVDRKHVAQPGG